MTTDASADTTTATTNGDSPAEESSAEESHFDVVVIGAGISGIGAGYHLQRKCPDRSFVILDGRERLGGTWDLFRYPGVRSDSDMHTLGYSFKPWTDAKAIADGPAILSYLEATAAEFGIDKHMRFGHLVRTASWSSDTARWTLTADVTDKEGTRQATYTCSFLFMCSGYYSYKGGYTPEFAGIDQFQGQVIHPQKWPEDLDYADKNVVVIGSGATTMTLVPAMARATRSITMLQRSPTYVVSRPAIDRFANRLRRLLPDKTAYSIIRWRNTKLGELFYKQTRKQPAKIKQKLLDGVREGLGPDFDVDAHFTPSYDPWDQRLCLIPDGDLFDVLKDGSASVVTDTIETFDAAGIVLTSGARLEADIVITATGLQLVTVGEMDFSVDGEPVDFAQTYTYKGLAYSDVPNMVSSFGYINASWTLRSDLTCDFVCRLLNHMIETNTDQATPRLSGSDANMPTRPWIEGFSSGYMQRDMAMMPKQGDKAPWVNPQLISVDKKMIEKQPVDDGVMKFTKAWSRADRQANPRRSSHGALN